MVRPSHASIVSPAGTVLAFGFCAGPQTPFGKADADRGVSSTSLTANGWPSSEVSPMEKVVSSVAEYIGATPRPGADTVADFDPEGAVSCSASAGAVVTKDVPPRVVVVGSPARVLRDVPDDELLGAG